MAVWIFYEPYNQTHNGVGETDIKGNRTTSSPIPLANNFQKTRSKYKKVHLDKIFYSTTTSWFLFTPIELAH